MTRMTTTMSNGQGQSVSYCLLKHGIWRKMFVGCIRTALELFMIEEFNKKWAYFTLSTYTTHTHTANIYLYLFLTWSDRTVLASHV